MNPALTFAAIAAAALMAGCASTTPEPGVAKAKPAEDCVRTAPATGTMIVKREDCKPSTEESRAEARRRAEQMRQEQEMRNKRASQSGG